MYTYIHTHTHIYIYREKDIPHLRKLVIVHAIAMTSPVLMLETSPKASSDVETSCTLAMIVSRRCCGVSRSRQKAR